MSGFQKQVNRQQAPAVAGDFASANPRASVLAGEAGLVAGASGVTVGKFAWVASDGVTTYNYGTNPNAPNGFVHREQQGLITTWLAESTMTVPQVKRKTIQGTLEEKSAIISLPHTLD